MPFFHFDPVQLLDLLHNLEWGAYVSPAPLVLVLRCHICGGDKPNHVDRCRLAAMLTELADDLAQFKAIKESP
jgi:hypothetical protein